jgi:hypothetical protein
LSAVAPYHHYNRKDDGLALAQGAQPVLAASDALPPAAR